MSGSATFGNCRRAAVRSPPCRSEVAPALGIMAITLTFLALLIEAIFGYPDWLMRTIGHPVMWMGRLIGILDVALNRETMRTAEGRAAGAFAVLAIVTVAAIVAYALEWRLLLLPLGVAIAAIAAS